MSINHTTLNNNLHLISITGRLDQDQAPLLETELSHLIQDSYYQILVDLSEVNYINSAGLRCLVGTWRKARENGGNLSLSGLNERLREVFKMVGFDKVFQIYPTAAQAEEAFAQNQTDKD